MSDIISLRLTFTKGNDIISLRLTFTKGNVRHYQYKTNLYKRK
jgi:hypothetical protein